jgi:hypothetical protein
MEGNYLRLLWKIFDRGDPLSDKELESLLRSSNDGIAFLEVRGETGGVLFKARLDLEKLMSFKLARERNKNPRCFP